MPPTDAVETSAPPSVPLETVTVTPDPVTVTPTPLHDAASHLIASNPDALILVCMIGAAVLLFTLALVAASLMGGARG